MPRPREEWYDPAVVQAVGGTLFGSEVGAYQGSGLDAETDAKTLIRALHARGYAIVATSYHPPEEVPGG